MLSQLKSFLNPNQPGFVIFYVTNRCNFRCNFCFYRDQIDKGLKPDELSVDEIRKMTEKLGPLVQLSMTGGEVFVRKEFKEISELFFKNCSPLYVTIPTNASMPKRIYDYYSYFLPKYPKINFRCAFSIEGIGEVHDKLRDVPGSFEKIKESFTKMYELRKKYKNIVLDSNSVFTADSEDTLLDTVKYLDKNFDFDNISITNARGKIPDENLKSKARSKYVKVNDYIDNIERNREGRFLSSGFRAVNTITRENVIKVGFDDKFVDPCVAGKKIIVISETGDVFPCEILGKKMGNIKESNYNVSEILNTEKSKNLKKWIKETKCKCTFECATASNAVWNYKNIPKIIKATTKAYLRDK
ncbi:radical SAM protein [Candidatus Pelagibacter sp.]|jgi:radical SAM protein with 4Fe4S-binding SPASM domain|nr:radical SAM protein [Candidatus Pelagibacter sp.]